MKPIFNLIVILSLFSFMSAKQLRQTVIFELELPEASLPDANDSLFLAGDFNGWHTADTAFCFSKDRKGHYVLKTKLLLGEHAFKVVRGNWQTVETDSIGGAISNRILDLEKQTGRSPLKVTLKVAGWADRFPRAPVRSTAAGNVKIMDSTFLIPQLNRKRRIWVYLPKNYEQNTQTHYPVIYMQDGQNVFDEATAFSGEWGVDEYLNSLPDHKQCIVVAIDNGGNERMQEYNPYPNKQFGRGEGKRYAAFLAEVLKPFVDAHYRTKPAARFTTICGSSMGGLISYYTAITYPQIFGRAGVFSPSFWIAPDIYPAAKKALPLLGQSGFYFYGGDKEGDSLDIRLRQMKLVLDNNETVVSQIVMDPEGMHQEQYWRKAFAPFYHWLLTLQSR